MNKNNGVKKIWKIAFIALLCSSYLISYNVTLALTGSAAGSPSGNAQGTMGVIENPLGKSTGTLSVFVAKILHILFEIGAIVVVFMIILSGFKFVLAQGAEKEITDAKNMLFGTLIGAVILLGAETISQVISNTVKELAK